MLARAARVLDAIERARKGDPLDLVRILWPTVVLDEFQKDVIRSVFDPSIREVYVKGNTGCGKGGSAAITICLFYIVWPDSKTVITRDSHDKAVKVMFGEVAKWWRRMAFCPVKAQLQTEAIVDPDRREHHVVVANPATDEGFSGVHAPHVLHVYDEATAPVLEPRYNLSETQATKFLALANPRTTSGRFRNAFPQDEPDRTQTVLGPKGYRRCITIGGLDCMNVREKRLENPVAPPGGMEINGRRFEHGDTIPPDFYAHVRPIIPGQTCYDTFLGLCANPDPEFVRVFAHGKFPHEDPERQVILGSWVRASCARHARWRSLWDRSEGRSVRALLERILPVECAGLDVAASASGDWTVLAAGGKYGVRALHRTQFADTMRTAGWVISKMREAYGIDVTKGGFPIAVDYDGGYGMGVGDRLSEQGVWIIPIKGSASPEVNEHRYRNKRAECWGELGLRLDPLRGLGEKKPTEDGGEEPLVRPREEPVFMLPDDQRLRDDLTAPEKLYGSDGIKFGITPKEPVPGLKQKTESLKERLGRSPDDGDAVVYLFRAVQAVGADLMEWLEAGAF